MSIRRRPEDEVTVTETQLMMSILRFRLIAGREKEGTERGGDVGNDLASDELIAQVDSALVLNRRRSWYSICSVSHMNNQAFWLRGSMRRGGC